MVRIAKYFNSIDYVVVCVCLFQIMLIIDTATLLYTSFPVIMNEYAKITASCFGAVTIEAFLLMVSVNLYLFHGSYGIKSIPIIFGIFSMLMTLFFMDTFTDSDLVVTYKRVFISFIFGTINYLLCEVFVKKWQEHNKNEDLEINLNSTISDLETANEIIKDRNESLEELNNMNFELKKSIHEMINELKEKENYIIQLSEQLMIKEQKLTRKHKKAA